MMNDKKPKMNTIYMPIFMCIGISVGMAIGAPSGNIPIGMSIGIGSGLCLGGIIDHFKGKKTKDLSDNENNNNE